jgi:thiol-disulfide isomerase/thioredoxin
MQLFTYDRLAALQAEGRTVLVQFDAPACGVCQAQSQALQVLAGEPLPAPAVLRAAFAGEESFRKRYGVTAPSTLLLFKGGELLGRAAGLTSGREIRHFVREHRMRYRFRPGSSVRRPFIPKR